MERGEVGVLGEVLGIGVAEVEGGAEVLEARSRRRAASSAATCPAGSPCPSWAEWVSEHMRMESPLDDNVIWG